MDTRHVKPIRTIGVDIALNKTGWAVLNSKKRVMEADFLELKPSMKLSYEDKVTFWYSHFYQLFSKVLKENYPTVLAIEGRLKAGWRAHTLASIEGARVAVQLAFTHASQNLSSITELDVHDPNDLKLEFAGKRNANKEDMKNASSQFSSFTGIDYQEDIYDSIFLALRSIDQRA